MLSMHFHLSVLFFLASPFALYSCFCFFFLLLSGELVFTTSRFPYAPFCCCRDCAIRGTWTSMVVTWQLDRSASPLSEVSLSFLLKCTLGFCSGISQCAGIYFKFELWVIWQEWEEFLLLLSHYICFVKILISFNIKAVSTWFPLKGCKVV